MAPRLELPASERPSVSFLVIAARKADPLRRSLEAIATTARGVETEVVIVLNAATPEVRRLVRDSVRGAVVAESEVGLGFAGGLNLAREQARGEYLAIVHDDSEVAEDWLAALLARAEAEPLVGMAGGVVRDPGGEVQTAGVLSCRDGSSLPLREDTTPAVDLGRPRYVDFVSCSASLIRAEAWDSFGGAEERLFPSFYVDSDLGLAIAASGRVVAYEPAARSLHAREHEGYPGPLEFVQRRNGALLAEKWADELTGHEPETVDHDNPRLPDEIVLAAVEACQRRAAAAIERHRPAPALPAPPREPGERERAHLERAIAIWKGAAEEIEREHRGLGEEFFRLADENARLRAKLDGSGLRGLAGRLRAQLARRGE